MKGLKTLVVLCGLCVGIAQAESPFDAARNGDLEALRQYRFEGIDLYVPDERGFIPYELAALHADPDKADVLQRHVESMLWLKEFQAGKHRYGKATHTLIQAGLNALGYDAGSPDGVMGERTADAIRAYQRDNELAETGRPGPQWLGMFYQDSLKDLQYKLSKLGYETHGTDGVMGPNTRNAMLRYRRDNELSNPDYPYLDGLLLSSVDGRFKKQEKARKNAIEEKARKEDMQKTRYAQAGLRGMGYRIGKIDGVMGSKTANAIKAFQRKNQLESTGELDKKTRQAMRKAFTKDAQRKLNAIGYQVGKPDGLLGQRSIVAIRKYRVSQGLEERGGVDVDMLSSLHGKYVIAENKRQTEARQNAGSRVRFAQAGLRTLGYSVSVDGHMGKGTQRAIKAFQKRYKLKRTGRLDKRTYAKMRNMFLKETQRKLNALGYRVGKPDGQMGSRTVKALRKFGRANGVSGGLSSSLIVAVDDNYDSRKRKNKKTSSKKNKTVAKRKTTKSNSAKPARNSRKSTRRQPSQSTAAVVQPTVTFNTPKVSSPRPVARPQRSVNRGGRSARGRMTFKRSGGRVVGCSLAGRHIPIEWCEPFYPLPRNNHCEATFKPSNGAVINLWCK